jgi:hypothetical protein
MRRLSAAGIVVAAMTVCAFPLLAQNNKWNFPGLAQVPQQPAAPGAGTPAPKRDLSGIWDAGQAGIGARGWPSAPLTPAGEAISKTHHSGDGIRMVPAEQINDPLSILADPGGFPRQLLFELRPFQIVQTPNQVLMLYMWEKRWRVIWTDGRQLPTNPDPRWYGYSVGHWEDDSTFVVNSNGTDDRTWLDNSGNPHSNDLKVEERYHRVNKDTLELTVTLTDPTIYTAPWTPRNKTQLKLLPPDTDFMEMIPSASESAAVRSVYALESAPKK